MNYRKPTTQNLYKIAADIAEHSEDQTVSYAMLVLGREAVVTNYNIEEEEEE